MLVKMKLQSATKRNNFEILVALAIISIVLVFVQRDWRYGTLAVLSILLGLFSPNKIEPLTRLWLTLGHILGMVNSRILLTFIFFFMVTPLALIRRLVTRNSMTDWKYNQTNNSMFIDKMKNYNREDFDKAF